MRVLHRNAGVGRQSLYRHALLGGTALTMVLFGNAPEVFAADWTGASSSDWFAAGNWNPATVPTSATNPVNINTNGLPHDPLVNAPGAQAGYISLGTNVGQIGNLTIDGLGNLAVTSTGGFSNLFLVGDNGTGTVTVSNGGTLSSGVASIANNGGSTGTVTVTGAGSSWAVTQSFFDIGSSGNGALNILNGGHVSGVGGMNIGDDVAAQGTVTVSGTGSTLALGGGNFLSVGAAGTALDVLNVQNGGNVSGGFVFVASGSGSNARATVTGAGSVLTASLSMGVGGGGNGTLEVLNGGNVTDKGIFSVAGGAGTVGNVVVNGATTKFNTGNFLSGTGGGAGFGNFSGGATITTIWNTSGANVFLGNGTFTVTDPGTTWNIGGNFTNFALGIGASTGTANLNVLNGATVTIASTATDGAFADVRIGISGTGKANLTIDGAGSTLTTPYNLYTNFGGTGNTSVTISNGGTLNSGFSIIANNSGSLSNVVVTGANSLWNIVNSIALPPDAAQGLDIGFSGNGNLTIANSGAVHVNSTTGQVLLGLSGGTGTLNIGAGNGSAPAAPGNLTATTVIFGTATSSVNFNHTSNGYTFAPQLTGGSGLGTVNVLAGTTIFTNDNTYSGPTNISPGAVAQFGNATTTGSLTGNITDNGSVVFDRSNNLTYAGIITGNGTLSQIGAGNLTLTGNSTFTGNTTIAQGSVLQLGSSGLSGSLAGLIIDNGTLVLQRSTAFTFANIVSGSGSLIKNGSSAALFTGQSTYTGGTLINSGTIQLGGNDRLATTGALNTGLGIFDLNGFNQTVGDFSGNSGSRVLLGNGTLTAGTGNSTLFAGNMSGAGNFTKQGAGTIIFTFNNPYTGTTTISQGTLQLGNDTANGSVAGNIVDNGTLALNRTGNVAFANTVTGSGIIDKLGNNTVTITGTSNAFAGTTDVDGGTVLVNGSLGGAVSVASGATLGGTGNIGGTVTAQNGGHIAPGASPGTLTIGGDLILNDTSVLDYQLDTPNVVGSGVNDLIAVGNNLTLDGILNVSSLGNFGNGTYTLITYGGGLTDNGLSFGTMPSGFTYGLKSGSGEVDLIVGANAASGPTQYWDGTHSVGNGVVDGGNGVWNAGNTNWTDAGGVINTNWGNQTAVFEATPGNVSVVGPITFTGMQFLTNNYQITPGAGGVLITNTPSTQMFTDLSVTATISAPITGTGGLDKTGAGSLLLYGNNTYSGGTTIDSGTIALGQGNNFGSIVGAVTINAGGQLFVLNTDVSGMTTITSNGGRVYFDNDNTTAGLLTITNNAGNVSFNSASTAGNATITNNGAASIVQFYNSSKGGNATISTGTGNISFNDNSTAANAHITVASGGATVFTGTSTAGSAVIANSGNVTFTGNATGGSATITDNSGGILIFAGNASNASGAHVFNNAGGLIDISTGNTSGVSIGTAEGAGNISLGNRTLTLGASNQASAEIGGIIADGGIGGGTHGALVKTGTGGLILSGDDTYTGTTTIASGTLQLGNGGTAGSVAGNIVDNGVLAVNHSNTVTIANAISGTGLFRQIGTGTTIFTGTNTYTGGTTIITGTLQLGNGGAAGSLAGNVVDNTVFAINRSDTFVFSGTVSGVGAFRQLGSGTTVFTADQTYTGVTTISAGMLQLGNGGTIGSVAGNVTDNGTLAFNHSNALLFSGIISGTGGVAQNGGGTTTLSAVNTYNGATVVNAGTLSVNGSIASSAVTVNAGGTLAGNGTVGPTLINGGTLAPGNSIGTLSVSGNLTFTSAGIYRAEVSPSAADLTNVSGRANVAGTVQAVAIGSNYTPGTQYTLINATGGVSGTFGSLSVVGDFGSAVRVHLGYDANHVYLDLDPNAISPFLSGATINEGEVAGAIDDTFGGGNAPPSFLALFNLSSGALNTALASMSGEIHASLRSAALDDSRFVRQAVMKRLGAGAEDGVMPAQGATADGSAIWGQAYGSWGGTAGDGNAADFNRDIGGIVAGVDTLLGGAWRLGVAAGYSRSSGDIAAVASSSGDSAAHVAAYVGTWAGPWRLRLGAANAWDNFTTNRVAAFPGFVDNLKASYSGRTTQAFGEAGYRLDAGGIPVEPYAGITYVNLHTDAFQESGGAAALDGAAQSEDVTYSTLGVRTGSTFQMMDGTAAVHGAVAWQHGMGADTPFASLAFASSGASFVTAGVPLARDSALIDLGAGWRIDPGIVFSLDYSGQLASGFTDHGVKGYVSWSF